MRAAQTGTWELENVRLEGKCNFILGAHTSFLTMQSEKEAYSSITATEAATAAKAPWKAGLAPSLSALAAAHVKGAVAGSATV